MPEIVLNGPVVRRGVHNVVLRDAVLNSPSNLPMSISDYSVVSVGIREDAYTSWIGTWDQSKQRIVAGTAVSILDAARRGMRLKENQALVVRVSEVGGPVNLDGSRVNFLMAEVGGRQGAVKPLVSTGAVLEDPDARAAVSALEQQVNGRLSEWEEPVQLRNVTRQIVKGSFQGRLQRDSATQISLQRYTGNYVEVDGESIPIGSLGMTRTNADGLLTQQGSISTTAPSANTLYCIYIGYDQIRLCATAPSYLDGVYYLGDDLEERKWRFCGWVFTNGSTQFTDDETAREVINYYNRHRLRLYTCPDYLDDNAATTYTETSTSWTAVNAASGSDVTYIANAEDDVVLYSHMHAAVDAAATYGLGIGIDGPGQVETSSQVVVGAADDQTFAVTQIHNPTTAGRHTASMLARTSAGNVTVYADAVRNGATADPAESYLVGHVMG
jgi:hypothetical protein